jgi:Cthe_2314-like HEPN
MLSRYSAENIRFVKGVILDLDLHPFVHDVLEKVAAVDKLLGNRSRATATHDYAREPDEHEFFLIRVAISMAEVLNCWHQLDQIPILLANHCQTATMDKAGINRHSQIVYHVENYLIRTQSLLDRILKLIDAVFHLLNDPRNCRYEVVIKNVKVQVSEIPESIKSFKKLLE